MNAVQGPGAAALVIDAQRTLCCIGERALVNRVTGFLVSKSNSGGSAVGNHGLIRERIDSEGAGTGSIAIGGIPVHAVTIHIQHTATGAECQVSLNLVRILDDNGGTGIHQHIVCGIAIALLQVGSAIATHVQECIGITLAVDIKVAIANLAPLRHVIGVIVQLQVHLDTLINDIASRVQLFAGACNGVFGQGLVALVELHVASAHVHRGIQNNLVISLPGSEYQVLRVEEVGIVLVQFTISIAGGVVEVGIIGIPGLEVLDVVHITPGELTVLHAVEGNRLVTHGDGAGINGGGVAQVVRNSFALGRHRTQMHLICVGHIDRHVVGLHRLIGPDKVTTGLAPGATVTGLVGSHILILPGFSIVNEHRAAGVTTAGGIRQRVFQAGANAVAIAHILVDTKPAVLRIPVHTGQQVNITDIVDIRPGQRLEEVHVLIIHTHDTCTAVVHMLAGQGGRIYCRNGRCHRIRHNTALTLHHVVITILFHDSELVGPANIQHRVILSMRFTNIIGAERTIQRTVMQHRCHHVRADQRAVTGIVNADEINHPLLIGKIVGLRAVRVLNPDTTLGIADMLQQ